MTTMQAQAKSPKGFGNQTLQENKPQCKIKQKKKIFIISNSIDIIKWFLDLS